MAKPKRKKRYIWIIMTDTHNGAVDFQAFRKEPAAKQAYIDAVNDIFGTNARTFDEASDIYERENERPFNEDFIRFESLLLR